MSEITEDYCSFEVSKLLKEKGFNELCNRYYNSQFDEMRTVGDICMMNWNSISINDEFYYISIPTQQMAMKWLREKYNICIIIYPDIENGYEAVLYDIENNVEIVLQSFGVYGIHIYKEIYEEAVEAALKYCLENLI